MHGLLLHMCRLTRICFKLHDFLACTSVVPEFLSLTFSGFDTPVAAAAPGPGAPPAHWAGCSAYNRLPSPHMAARVAALLQDTTCRSCEPYGLVTARGPRRLRGPASAVAGPGDGGGGGARSRPRGRSGARG